MGVVINELEVIFEQASREAPVTTRPVNRTESQTPRTLRAADVLRIIAWHERRMERLAAE
jgi:hypothetical protein